MSGRWTKIAAAFGLAVVLSGCNPTAAPSKRGTAVEPLRRSASHVTRGTDRMVRGATGRGGTGTTTGNRGGLFNWFSRGGTRTGNRNMGAGTMTGTGTMTGAGTSTRPRVGTLGSHRGTITGGTMTGAKTGAGTPMGNFTGRPTIRGRTNTSVSPGAATGGTTSASKGWMAGTTGRLNTKTRTGVTGPGTAASRTRVAAGGTTGTTATNGKPLHVIGFFTEDASSKGLTALGRDPKAISYLAPWWYTLRADGSIKDKSTAATRTWAKSHNVPITPLVTNGGQHAVLMNDTAMRNAVNNLTQLVLKNNYAGINVDFQGLPSTSRSGLNAFVDDLAHQMHAHGKILAVDIIPTQAQTGSGGAYDEVSLGRYADQLVLMTYDHHDDSSPPGPVSPHAWVVAAVKHTLSAGVPASKVVLGVNDYGYDWNTTKKTAVTIPQKVATTAPAKNKSYNPTTKESKVAYTQNGQQHVAYYGGFKALADKVTIAKQYKLQGIAIWKVGYENQAYWNELLKVNGDAASLHQGTGASSSSAAFTHKKGAKGITHRPIGTKSGRTSGATHKGTKGKGTMTHGGTSRSKSGTKRGTK